MADATGRILEIAEDGNIKTQIIKRIIILVTLMALTDDRLCIEGSAVTIVEYCESPAHPVGTDLIRTLVAENNTITIGCTFVSIDGGSRTTPDNWDAAVLGEEQSSRIIVDLTQIDSEPYKPTGYVLLGHELIHALHFAQGTYHPIKEETITTGIGFYEFEQFSENAIRREHGLNDRLQY